MNELNYTEVNVNLMSQDYFIKWVEDQEKLVKLMSIVDLEKEVEHYSSQVSMNQEELFQSGFDAQGWSDLVSSNMCHDIYLGILRQTLYIKRKQDPNYSM